MKLTYVESVGIKKLEQYEKTVEFVDDDGVEDQVINVYPQVKYQSFEGFGGAITDAAGYVFQQLDPEQQERLLTMYFHPDHMNYRKVRIHMDSCDFSTHLYSAISDPQDQDLESFDFSDTEKYILPLLAEAQKMAQKPLKIMLSPWSPPEFMKTNDSRKNGGSLKKEYYPLWAKCICRYITEFEKRGYEVERISIQNEPKAVQLWDSCVYSAEQEKEFLTDHLYPAMKQAGLEHVEIFIWDHNKERVFERACDLIDATTDGMIAGTAFHWYSGDHFEALNLVRQQFPDKKLILSESCLEYNKFDSAAEAVNAGRLAHDMIGNLNHGLNAFYDWNILLNKEGGPNHVGNYCDAPFLFDEDRKELLQRMSADYYWHFAHFIQPGAVRLGFSRYTDEIDVTAWENPDGRIVLILLNRGDKAIPAHIRISGKETEIVLSAHSIVSGVISGE
jgi:glucosylceramidase